MMTVLQFMIIFECMCVCVKKNNGRDVNDVSLLNESVEIYLFN